eukprot:3184697-Amphidinium_carterae.1
MSWLSSELPVDNLSRSVVVCLWRCLSCWKKWFQWLEWIGGPGIGWAFNVVAYPPSHVPTQQTLWLPLGLVASVFCRKDTTKPVSKNIESAQTPLCDFWKLHSANYTPEDSGTWTPGVRGDSEQAKGRLTPYHHDQEQSDCSKGQTGITGMETSESTVTVI